ncbi:hypothetical protein THRCLA_11872 [Thraustotheca clavata]|uniref:Uncharacterized protein n=1 Tax=Thraustotheca clavata TaxID=74557 RepID=A0A1V9Y618_9STRA|nr:hypothetical protein THRCLA_11872 [Thraustotheca clavata]
MQTKPGPICIGEYAQRRTWCFDIVHLCQNLELRSCFFDVARACIADISPMILQSMTEHPDDWDAMPNATILITFLDECIALFYQRDSIEIAGLTSNISAVIANAPLGASVQIVGSFLETIVTESALVRYLLVEKCHIVYHFIASLTIDAVDTPVACSASTPEQYAAMQTVARVSTFPTEKSLLATLLANPKSCLIDDTYPLSLPPQDVELLLDTHRLCCIFACGFDLFLVQSLKCIVPEEPEVSRLTIKALLTLLDTVKATTLLESIFELLNAVLLVDDSYRGVRVDALFSPDQGILAFAFYYRHHRSFQHYTYNLLDYMLTSATEAAEVAAYLLRPDVKEQASWVRAWLWNFLQSDATVGDLNHEELDGESQLVLEVVEQLFGSKSEIENQVDQILLETHDIKTSPRNNKQIAFSDIKVDLTDEVNPAELMS